MRLPPLQTKLLVWETMWRLWTKRVMMRYKSTGLLLWPRAEGVLVAEPLLM
jgi:hypothetical protein